ncbi:hypothetical protein EOPP23_14235 [Endozoicomonas sp. OPT23]|uniref:KTSC domain-containing protein n=1 Tax=Endozoicomonas sp. OPT23 TaxID=2072845 RepID=UPI00129A2F0C|nr:KTSC domain-containing protein [Endozoicomonas sp. OPT23]MRI34148.1 hypothetical protein [Endozoicomonas sp. OPT23]
MTHTEFINSAKIRLATYNDESRRLQVELKQTDTASGTTYTYLNVPSKIFRSLTASDSPDQFYEQDIVERFQSV